MKKLVTKNIQEPEPRTTLRQSLPSFTGCLGLYLHLNSYKLAGNKLSESSASVCRQTCHFTTGLLMRGIKLMMNIMSHLMLGLMYQMTRIPPVIRCASIVCASIEEKIPHSPVMVVLFYHHATSPASASRIIDQ
ncbi:hypothetical protein ACROYT_G028038 [Oculina patagonica]